MRMGVAAYALFSVAPCMLQRRGITKIGSENLKILLNGVSARLRCRWAPGFARGTFDEGLPHHSCYWSNPCTLCNFSRRSPPWCQGHPSTPGAIVRWEGNSEGKSQGIRWNSAMTEGNSEGNSEGIRGNSGMKTGNSGFETGKMHWLLWDFGL